MLLLNMWQAVVDHKSIVTAVVYRDTALPPGHGPAGRTSQQNLPSKFRKLIMMG